MTTANETRIGLETAKLFKDCGVKSKYFLVDDRKVSSTIDIAILKDGCLYDVKGAWGGITLKSGYYNAYPAYTWQEILWEHADEFFGKMVCNDRCMTFDETISLPEGLVTKWTVRDDHEMRILKWLQQKQYDIADKYFRSNCILITKK
jgi:hypothetical protein